MAQQITEIPIDKIWFDAGFNCRGHVAPIDVDDLAASIAQIGLQNPISVQPAFDVPTIPLGRYLYRIAAGHRRFRACEKLKWQLIPCIVVAGLNDERARLYNLSENLHRASLNLLQEAEAIRPFKIRGVSIRQLAQQLHVTMFWVRVRYHLLEVGDDVRDAAAAGLISGEQLLQIAAVSPEKRREALATMREAREKGLTEYRLKRKRKPLSGAKPRRKQEVLQMVEYMEEQLKVGLYTRALLWAAGEINTAEMLSSMQQHAKRNGSDWKPKLEDWL